MNTFVLPEEERIPECIPQNQKMFKKGALVLDLFLAENSYLVEDRFTVTDIIVGYSLNWARMQSLTESFPSIDSYLKRLFKMENCVLPE